MLLVKQPKAHLNNSVLLAPLKRAFHKVQAKTEKAFPCDR